MVNPIKDISNFIKSITTAYKKASLWGKVLVFTVLLLLVVISFKGLRSNVMSEGFEQNDKFLLKSGAGIYDDFYANIYDYLVFNNLKDEYEVGQIINKTSPSSQSKILDVGSGTGHHVAYLGAKNLDVLGIDISPSMVKKAQENYPDYKFEQKDATVAESFGPSTFTHILCLYFTIYYFDDKAKFFANCKEWLKPGGYLIVHLVDREKFDPILPPGNPLMFVSPQKYAKERITSTKVKFNDFAYSADFQLDETNNVAKFVEKFKDDNTGKIRKNEHTLYMEDTTQIVQQAQDAGFFLEGKVDLIQCQYEYQYLYIFVIPN